MLNIVVPMAGDGTRFNETGHKEPKPLIPVIDGKPMIQLVVECLTPSVEHRFIFICRREHDEEYDLDHLFKTITTRYEKVIVDGVTEGPACSVLLAKQWFDNNDPMMTACADDYVNVDIDEFISAASQNDAEGTIMTYLGSEPAGSSAKITQDEFVTEVAEKKLISPYMTVGVYYFDQGKDYVEATEQMIRNDKRANGEFYVSPVYNEMIARGQPIKSYPIDEKDMHTMGTPETLKEFQRLLESHPEIILK